MTVSTERQPEKGAFGAWLRSRRQAGGWTLRGLADHAGVSSSYLSQIERGHRTPSVEILRAIAGSLDLPMESVFAHAGYLEPRELTDVEAAIGRDPQLDIGQKRRLVAAYRSMRDQATVAER